MTLLAKLRLRHKMSLLLSAAALFPIVLAAIVAGRVVLRGLEEGLRDQTARQLRIAMNLVLRNVEHLGSEAVQLASAPALPDAISRGETSVTELLSRADPHLPSALVQVADAEGRILCTHAVGANPNRYEGLALMEKAPIVQRGLAYERRVTIATFSDQLVVRAVAPVVDASFLLRGVVIISLPLDGDFADGIKGALGTDILIHAGSKPANSSFLDEKGGRPTRIEAPPGVTADVLAGATRISRLSIGESDFQVGYSPLKNLDGEHVGMLGVAVDRDALRQAKRTAAQSLVLGAFGAFLFALALASWLARRLTEPIARLHEGALAVARGDLSCALLPSESSSEEGDEIADLAQAFSTMTWSLRENQDRLAARMREIMALHEAGRAVTSVLGLEDVLRTIVGSVARVLDTRLAAIWLVSRHVAGRPELRIGAARARHLMGANIDARHDVSQSYAGTDAAELAEPFSMIAEEVARARTVLRIPFVEDHPALHGAGQVAGSLLAVPLERQRGVVGVLVVGRAAGSPPFGEADERLLLTFADQAAAAVENARLYEEVRAFNEALEEKVDQRTGELTAANAELGRTLNELRETQAQLVLSEHMAGLGTVVAGVAHEINSPAGAIRGTSDVLWENVQRLAARTRALAEMHATTPSRVEDRRRFLALVEEMAPRLAWQRISSPADVRHRARVLARRLAEAGHSDPETESLARVLVEIGADAAVGPLLAITDSIPLSVSVGYLEEYAYVHRNTVAIQTAIKQIQRIVGALKSYSHLDQAKIEPADLHEGLENTLVLLHHELKYGISVTRRYGRLPVIPLYVDEINQVWTNLIHNAVQAMGGKGEIMLETSPPRAGESMVAVRVIDSGPGIAPEVIERVFEPFFTTKAKGEGTGIGLGVVRKIVEKHEGRVEVESKPGRTCFTVRLPVSGPLSYPATESA